MNSLLNGYFAPITYSWGFLDAPILTVNDTLVKWHSGLRRRTKVHSACGDLQDALSLLNPLETPWTKELLICTKSPWTAYFNNQSIGGDPFPPVSYLSQLLGCQGLIVQSFPDGSSGFLLTGAEQTDFLNVKRSVLALNDGNSRWKFSENGTPLPFEETERYASRKIRERLDDEMLDRYFAVFGIHLFDNEFYGGNYTLLSMRQEAYHFSRISLDAYREGLLPEHAKNRGALLFNALRGLNPWA